MDEGQTKAMSAVMSAPPDRDRSDAAARVDELIAVRNSLMTELDNITKELETIQGMIRTHFESPAKGY